MHLQLCTKIQHPRHFLEGGSSSSHILTKPLGVQSQSWEWIFYFTTLQHENLWTAGSQLLLTLPFLSLLSTDPKVIRISAPDFHFVFLFKSTIVLVISISLIMKHLASTSKSLLLYHNIFHTPLLQPVLWPHPGFCDDWELTHLWSPKLPSLNS